MIMKLERPDKIQEKIDGIENGLADLFSNIAKQNNLDLSEIALVPLFRRGAGLLPDIVKARDKENSLVSILEKFGYIEKYALFPSINKISNFNTILIFDDVCRGGTHLNEYKNYLEELGRIFPQLEDKNVIRAAYLIRKNAWEKEIQNKKGYNTKIYYKKSLDGVKFDYEISNIFLTIACRGEIIDPDHKFVEVSLKNKQNFFKLWRDLEEIAKNNHCKLIEDGINFLHPARKKLALFVTAKNKESIDKKPHLEDLDFEFPEFVEEIEIAKLRIVFELELSKSKKEVFTSKFEMVPILNPIIDNNKFSPELCSRYWESNSQFCKKGIISKEECREKREPRIDFLRRYYYNPGYDCIICNLVEHFSCYFFGKVEHLLEGNIEGDKVGEGVWYHRDRLHELWKRLDGFQLES